MKPLYERLLSLLFAALTVVALSYMSMAELSRRGELAAEIARINVFMAAGERLPLRYGLGLCERVRVLEINAGRADPVDCDAIRHGATMIE